MPNPYPENDARLAAVYKLLTHLDILLISGRFRDAWEVLEHVRVWVSPDGRPRREGVSYAEMRVEIRQLLDKWGIQ